MPDQSEWLSLGEAAKVLGVHPTTVRNWADHGELPFRRTPGRHRRFQRAVLEEWATKHKTDKESKTASSGSHAQAIVEYALGHTRFSMNPDALKQLDWYEKMSPTAVNQSRLFGRQILEALLLHLEDKEPEEIEFQKAHAIGDAYGKMLLQEELSLTQVVRGFTYFSDFLIESVVQIMAPRLSSMPSEWGDLLQQINAFTSEVLISMLRHYQ